MRRSSKCRKCLPPPTRLPSRLPAPGPPPPLQNIVVYLVKMLERSNVELLILATTFLKKLSIYKVRRPGGGRGSAGGRPPAHG